MKLESIIISACILIGLSTSAQAQSISSVIKSPYFQYLNRQKHPREKLLYREAWRDEGSNIASLFDRRLGGPKQLIDWLGHPSVDFEAQAQQVSIGEKAVMVSQEYLIKKDRKKIQLIVLVPSPSYKKIIDYGISQGFKAYMPSHQSIKQQEEIELETLHGTLYFLNTDVECLLHLKLEDHVLFNLYLGDCDKNPDMIQLAESLDVKAMMSKLKDRSRRKAGN